MGFIGVEQNIHIPESTIILELDYELNIRKTIDKEWFMVDSFQIINLSRLAVHKIRDVGGTF